MMTGRVITTNFYLILDTLTMICSLLHVINIKEQLEVLKDGFRKDQNIVEVTVTVLCELDGKTWIP